MVKTVKYPTTTSTINKVTWGAESGQSIRHESVLPPLKNMVLKRCAHTHTRWVLISQRSSIVVVGSQSVPDFFYHTTLSCCCIIVLNPFQDVGLQKTFCSPFFVLSSCSQRNYMCVDFHLVPLRLICCMVKGHLYYYHLVWRLCSRCSFRPKKRASSFFPILSHIDVAYTIIKSLTECLFMTSQ